MLPFPIGGRSLSGCVWVPPSLSADPLPLTSRGIPRGLSPRHSRHLSAKMLVNFSMWPDGKKSLNLVILKSEMCLPPQNLTGRLKMSTQEISGDHAKGSHRKGSFREQISKARTRVGELQASTGFLLMCWVPLPYTHVYSCLFLILCSVNQLSLRFPVCVYACLSMPSWGLPSTPILVWAPHPSVSLSSTSYSPSSGP